MQKYRVQIERSAVEKSFIDIDAESAERAEEMVDQLADHHNFAAPNPTEFSGDTESVWVATIVELLEEAELVS